MDPMLLGLLHPDQHSLLSGLGFEVFDNVHHVLALHAQLEVS